VTSSPPPYLVNDFVNNHLELFASLFNQFGKVLIMSSCFFFFHFSIYLLPCLCLHHLAVQRMVLRFVLTMSTLLHCHCPFHVAIRSASHNIQTTLAGLPVYCLLCYIPLSLNSNVCGLETFLTLLTYWWNFFASFLL
jgi:hypothetical protein